MNVKKVLNCKASNILRKHLENITDEDILKTELFRKFNYKNASLLDFENTDFEKENYRICDIIDNFQRACIDEAVIKIGIDYATQYILENCYSCKSNNEYDFTFLFDSLCKELFIIKAIDNGMIDNLAYVNGNCYLYRK